MNFRFFHAADIHLDSPLRGLSFSIPERAQEFRNASRRAFENLVSAVVDYEVDFLVIAGDLFDGDWRDYKTGLFFAQKMGELSRAGIQVFIVEGNHDAKTVIRKKLPWPENVTIFPSRKPATEFIKTLKVALHGQSYQRSDVTENIALNYPSPNSGFFNIGVLHTACEGREGHLPYAPCSKEQLATHGYDYWALGHVHRREVIQENPHIIFPGNLQGRHIRERGPKGATLVHVTDGSIRQIEHIILDVARWAQIDLDISGYESKQELFQEFRSCLNQEITLAEERPIAVRIYLNGTTPLHYELTRDPVALRAQIESAALEVSDQFSIEKIKINTNHPSENTLSSRSDVLGELIQLVDESIIDPSINNKLAEELRGLTNRLPRSEMEDLPSEEQFNEILLDAKKMLIARLFDGEGS